MAEFAVFATSQDQDHLLETALVALGLKAYPSPIPVGNPITSLATPEQVAHYIAAQPTPWPATSFFLAADEWGADPVLYDLCDSNPRFPPFQFGVQRRGKPSIHFEPGTVSPSAITASVFSDYPYYYRAYLPGETLQRPSAIRTAMTMLQRASRLGGKVLFSPSHRKAIAMPGAYKAFDRGVELRHQGVAYGR